MCSSSCCVTIGGGREATYQVLALIHARKPLHKTKVTSISSGSTRFSREKLGYLPEARPDQGHQLDLCDLCPPEERRVLLALGH